MLVGPRGRRRFISTKAAVAQSHVVVKLLVKFKDGSVNTFSDGVNALLDMTNSSLPSIDWKTGGHIVAVEDDLDSRDSLSGFVEIAIPGELLGASGGMSLLLAIVTYYSSYSLIHSYAISAIDFPTQVAVRLGLEGPKCRIAKDLEFGALIKPRFLGDLNPASQYLQWLAACGFSLVVDDELTLATSDAHLKSRCLFISDQLEKGMNGSGTVAYVPNLTCRPADAPRLASIAQASRAGGVMVNVMTMGYDVLLDIRHAVGDIPILANVIGRGMVCGGSDFYYTEDVVCRLARLNGADAVYTGPFVGLIETSRERRMRIMRALAHPLLPDKTVEPSAAVMAGGLSFVQAWENAQAYDAPLVCLLGSSALNMYTAGVPSAAVREVISITKSSLDLELVEFRRKMRESVKHVKGVDSDKHLRLLGIE